MDSFFVSVIVPNYCHSEFLEARMDSILAQTYKNFEVIILDDCSNDEGRSRAIIEKYRSNPHIATICYNEDNSGNTFLQWQKGINIAKGDLIWLAESDDCCSPFFLESMINQFEKYSDCVLSYSTSQLIDGKGIPFFTPVKARTYHFSSKQYLKRYLLFGNLILNASSAVFKKTVMEEISDEYTKHLGAGDYLFWVEVAKQGSVSIVNQCLNQYRRHSGVVTDKMDSNGSNLMNEYKIFLRIQNYVKISGLRRRIAYSIRAKRIRYTSFATKEIQSAVESVWQPAKYERVLDVIGRKILTVCWNRAQYYL